jgi:hypothetical protein
MAETPRRPSERIEAAADKVEAAAGSVQTVAGGTWRSIRWVYAVLALIGVLVVGLLLLVLRLDDSVDAVQENDAEQTRVSNENADQIRELKAFVDDLQEVTPEEQAQTEAINRAVAQVPAIRELICDLADDLQTTLRGCEVAPSG